MRPSFVLEFTSLLLFGPLTTLPVAMVTTVAQSLADSNRRFNRRTLVEILTALAAITAAGLFHLALGGTPGQFAWPSQAVPVAAAAVAYCLVKRVSSDVIVPLMKRRPIHWPSPTTVARECLPYLIGASLAVGVVELWDRGMWEILPVIAVPLYFAHRAYRGYTARLEDAHRRKAIIDSIDQGMAVVNNAGRVTLWNDALERIAGCTREQALGRTLVSAMPMLGDTMLPRAVDDVLKDRKPRTLAQVGLPSAQGPRVLQIKILPGRDRVTLLWHDVSERARVEQALRRSEERFALAARGANDGLWDWDLRTRQFYFSGRWRAMVGLPESSAIGRLEDWLDRVHREDVEPLEEALRAHIAGQTEHFEHEHRIRHEDGTYRWVLSRGVAMAGAGGRAARMAGSLTDTSDRAAARERLRSAGFRDSLTGLRNRADFVDVLGRRLDEFKRRRATGRFAVLYLDLDRFKVVNDSLGHLVGDEMLVGVSRRLESCLREGDTLARLGGDEFAILLNTIADEGQANALAFQIQQSLSAPLLVAGREVFTTASIGIAFGHSQYDSPDEIMRDADTAMYHAKSHGKARHELFDADMHARVRDRLGLENDLRHAVSANDFEVHYQPIVSLASGMCVGFESLVRWTRNGEAISPVTFIPVAEELGLIEPLGTWVLQQACAAFADWQRRFPNAGLDCITVNASSRQLMQQNFLFIVQRAVQNARLSPSQLRIEVTETALMDSPHVVAEVLRQLRDFGAKIYLDDFGTGYSSLSHLHKLPVDALKIDRSFVRSLTLPDRPAIVESILALARTLNTSVVAEGIETEVQARELERLGCTHAQGFLFSRPVPTAAAEEILRANQPLGPGRFQTAGAPDENDAGAYYRSGTIKWPDPKPTRRMDDATTVYRKTLRSRLTPN